MSGARVDLAALRERTLYGSGAFVEGVLDEPLGPHDWCAMLTPDELLALVEAVEAAQVFCHNLVHGPGAWDVSNAAMEFLRLKGALESFAAEVGGGSGG